MTVISHKYKFIFIKTTKTAGTSVEVALSQICAPDDIVTPIFPIEKHHSARNFIAKNGATYYNHMPAIEIRRILEEDRFDDYFKFCVERHPIDKCISHFAMQKYSKDHRTWKSLFLTWSRYVKQQKFPIDHGKYTDENGVLIVDRILKYERLADEFKEVLERLAVPWSGLMSRAKGSYRRSRTITADRVKQRHRAVIKAAFETSNRFTGYE